MYTVLLGAWRQKSCCNYMLSWRFSVYIASNISKKVILGGRVLFIADPCVCLCGADRIQLIGK